MNQISNVKIRRAQSLTEYLILVCLIAAGSVALVTQFGNVIRAQMSSAAYELAGQAQEGGSAKDTVQGIEKKTKRGLDDFWKD
ncbi:MAG: hypothetical protein COV44_03355 [Deltaproteobacteria bacterium CG11_big_fil_rev_8_21_14_0_20_45_16]|nr:MAG: hypothetical protein COV44_03355 [Deltaproteobacteria bacterium CG11_big_fil_rev_8_21_14_0_20_45_16]